LKNVSIYQKFANYLGQSVSIAPLIVFRVTFGLLMLFSTIRYLLKGWVATQLIEPTLHFSYFGFDWVAPLPGAGMYSIFGLMIVTSLAIAIGAYYRVATIIFFLCFTYVELIDITYYLNHYYFVSIVAFLMILVPANRCFAIDAWRNQARAQTHVSLWCIGIFKLQIAIVYVCAGLAKINHDWLIKALPLAIWLPAKTSIPIIGWMFHYKITAYLFSWLGMLFDTFVIFALMWKKTRWLAYLAVVFFHTMTGILFQIGVFPLVMIFSVIIFFSSAFHEKVLNRLSRIIVGGKIFEEPSDKPLTTSTPGNPSPVIASFLIVFFLFQLLFPWRYLLYKGNVFWTEEGYRFAWRVMLMEKAGTATFYVKNGPDGREGSVINHQFLNPHQEKQMAMQPDLILQYAHHLKEHFQNKGMKNPQVRADVQVTLNARPAQPLIDPTVDLTQLEDSWTKKDWILPFTETKR